MLTYFILVKKFKNQNNGICRFKSDFIAGLLNNKNVKLYYFNNFLDLFWIYLKNKIGPSKRQQLAIIISFNHKPLFWKSSKFQNVSIVHDLVWKKYPETMQIKTLFSELIFFKAMIKSSHKLICVSHSTKADLISFYPNTSSICKVIYPGTNFNLEKQIGNNKSYFLFVGTFEPRKNINFLIDAFSQYIEKGKYDLILAGSSGWGNIDVGKQIKLLNLCNRVKIVSNPNDSDLKELYRNCTALIIPSIYEGFGLPIIEALSFYKPIVAANTSSLPEVANKAGIYFDPYDIKSLVIAMSKIEDPFIYDNLMKQTSSQRNFFMWKDKIDEFLKYVSEK